MPKKSCGTLYSAAMLRLPHELARAQIEAMQLSLRADRVHAIAVEDGARARAVVVAVAIFEIGRVPKAPVPRACLGMQALDDLFVADAVQEQKAIADDRRRRVAGPFGELPDERRRERSAQPRFGRNARCARARETRSSHA